MRCEPCVAECKAQGGFCSPLTTEDMEGAKSDGIANLNQIVSNHRQTQHRMMVIGASWTCSNLHTVDAEGVEVMKAAGIEPML